MEEGLKAVIYSSPVMLILGSFPGRMSLKKREYYAHPQNQFWLILAHVFQMQPPKTYEEKLSILKSNHIALWDICSKAERKGSLDADILKYEYNGIKELLAKNPQITRVVCNGTKAYLLFCEYCKKFGCSIDVYKAASTSPAYTKKLEEKSISWKEVLLK